MMYQDIKERMLDEYILNKDTITYPKRLILSRVFDVPLERTMEKTNVQLLQRSSASEIAQQMEEMQKPTSRPGTQRRGAVKGQNRRGRGMSQTDKIATSKVGD